MSEPATTPSLSEAPPQTPGSQTPPRPSRPTPPAQKSSTGRGWIAAAVIFALLAGIFGFRGAQLESKNSALAGRLSAAQAEIQALQGIVDGARERVGTLRGELNALDRFLAGDGDDPETP